MPLVQRSTYFIYPSEDELKVFDGIQQTKDHLTIPASKNVPLTRQEKLQVDLTELDRMVADPLIRVGMLDLQLNAFKNSTTTRKTVFNDFKNLNQGGLVINVAPQQAKSFEQYQRMSEFTTRLLLWNMNIRPSGKVPYFHEEWFRTHVYDLDELSHPEKSIMSLWEALFGETEMPIELTDLAQVSSFELIVAQGKLEMLFYWDEVVLPQRISKHRDVKQEVGIFRLENLDQEDYDLCVSGLRVPISAQDQLKFTPTLFYLNSVHNTLNGYTSHHQIAAPGGLHPLYQVSVEGSGEWKPQEECLLKFDMEIPSTLILDQYQVESKLGAEIVSVAVRNRDIDLELPVYKVDHRGSSLSATLNDTLVLQEGGFELPLHLRYGAPREGHSSESVVIPRGNLYWECAVDAEEYSRMRESLLWEDRLGLEAKGGVKLYHVSASANAETGSPLATTPATGATGGNFLCVSLPVADARDGAGVEMATLGLLAIASAWIALRLLRK